MKLETTIGRVELAAENGKVGTDIEIKCGSLEVEINVEMGKCKQCYCTFYIQCSLRFQQVLVVKCLSFEYRCVRFPRRNASSDLYYSFLFADTEGITVGKFYATFLIQEYFRKFKKKRQDERKKKNADSTVALKVNILNLCF